MPMICCTSSPSSKFGTDTRSGGGGEGGERNGSATRRAAGATSDADAEADADAAETAETEGGCAEVTEPPARVTAR